MSGTLASPIEATPYDSEENEHLRYRNHSRQEPLRDLTDVAKIMKANHQFLAGIMDNNFVYASEPFRKDEPTEKKEISFNTRTEDFERLKDGCTMCTTIALEVIKTLYQQLQSEQAAMKEKLESATQKIAMLTERLEEDSETMRFLQVEYDRVKADQRKFLTCWLEEAIAKQIIDVQKKQGPKTGGWLKPLFVGFLVTVTIASLVSVGSTGPNAG